MLSSYPKLNFPPIKIRAKRHADNKTISVWSSLRGCYLVLTPEEWVRRHLVEYLQREQRVSLQDMVEEYPVPLNGQPQRADLVVLRCGVPYMLVECKAPDVKLSQETLKQALRYNSVLRARYVVLTNGLTHICMSLNDKGEYMPLECFPQIIV